VGHVEDDMRDLIRGWVTVACREWSYPNVSEPYFDAVYERLPVGVRTSARARPAGGSAARAFR
jgi:hypothetical protein